MTAGSTSGPAKDELANGDGGGSRVPHCQPECLAAAAARFSFQACLVVLESLSRCTPSGLAAAGETGWSASRWRYQEA